MVNVDISEKLISLGKRLRSIRLDRNESQKRFAARLGVSIPTLYKMEQGDPNIKIGTWILALWLCDHINDADLLLQKKETLFDQYEAQKRQKKRQRATKSK